MELLFCPALFCSAQYCRVGSLVSGKEEEEERP